MNCCSFVSLKLEKERTVLANFDLEIFMEVQGRFQREETLIKTKRKHFTLH